MLLLIFYQIVLKELRKTNNINIHLRQDNPFIGLQILLIMALTTGRKTLQCLHCNNLYYVLNLKSLQSMQEPELHQTDFITPSYIV